jgi:1,5-anhydro-D-fructose reductase (1,5-anhydro-D-mannitol-forming)
MTIRFGICGFGKMGQTRAEAIEGQGGTVVRIFDTHLPDPSPYPVAESIDAVIHDPDVEAVVVCLPNFLNKATTIKALGAGKHVFCEKPPAFTGADVREIMAAEAASGRVLMYGFNHRQHGAVLEMKKRVASGAYGDVLWMRGRYGKSVDSDYLTGWRADPKLAGGGILLDQGIHMLDLMLHIAGQPFDEVHALVSNLYWNSPGIEDNVFALLRNTDTGLSASFHSTMTQWRHLFSLEVFLQRGYLVLNGLKTSSGTYGEEKLTIAKNRSKAPAATWESEESHVFKIDESWSREMELFFGSVLRGDTVTYGSSQQALDVMSVIDRIYASERHQSKHLFTDLHGDHEGVPGAVIHPPAPDGQAAL